MTDSDLMEIAYAALKGTGLVGWHYQAKVERAGMDRTALSSSLAFDDVASDFHFWFADPDLGQVDYWRLHETWVPINQTQREWVEHALRTHLAQLKTKAATDAADSKSVP